MNLAGRVSRTSAAAYCRCVAFHEGAPFTPRMAMLCSGLAFVRSVGGCGRESLFSDDPLGGYSKRLLTQAGRLGQIGYRLGCVASGGLADDRDRPAYELVSRERFDKILHQLYRI